MAKPQAKVKSGVSSQLEMKLRMAMDRLLAGKAAHTDGALTFENLHTEAGVSRATMNRSDTVVEFRRRIEAGERRSPEMRSKDELIAKLRKDLTQRQNELKEATRRLDGAATVIVALHRENETLRSTKPSPVTPFPPTNRVLGGRTAPGSPVHSQ